MGFTHLAMEQESPSTDKRTAEYLELSDDLYYSRSTFAYSAGIFLVGVKNRTIYDKIVKPWTACARVRQCIAPDGYVFTRHNHDQSVLNCLLAKHSIQLTNKAGESI